jgi:hypothetical protein
MKNYIKFLTIYFIVTIAIDAQWARVSTNNVGLSGKMLAHNSAIFLYGSHSGFKLYRSIDGGVTWNDIADKFPYDVYYMYVHQNEIFAITTTLGAGVYRFYTSTDDGASWSEKSNIPSVTGNGAVLQLSSDGSTLYACSNRKSYYKSNDNGLTWQETIINTTAGGNVVQLAAAGDNLISVFLGTGAVVSTDNGQTWNTKNPAGISVSSVYQYKGTIYGLSFGAGLFKWDRNNKDWVAINNGVPDGGSFQIPMSMVGTGNTIFTASRGLLSTKTTLLSSTDEGQTWNEISQEGLPNINAGSVFGFMAANSTNLFLFNYAFTGGGSNDDITGVYKTSITATSVIEEEPLPNQFELFQNYPNPLNPETIISYRLSAASNVSLKVYDVLGKEVITLVNEIQQPGTYNVKFMMNSALSTGIYFYKLQAGTIVQTRKMLFLK